VAVGQLITSSCTTGWLDWIHGDLWLLPDGLLRIPTGVAATASHGLLHTVSGDLAEREFTGVELQKIASRGKKNLWLQADHIKRADIHTGVMTSRVNLWMADGQKVKLLWIRGDHAERPLSTALSSWNARAKRVPD
jgi:hypothetical protein